MDRSKGGLGRGAKSKIAQHPADLFALGTKSSRQESSDPKRPNVIHNKPGTSSSSSLDRKKEAPTSIQSMIPPKKPKLMPGVSSQLPRAQISNAEAWEGLVMDCDPADLVPLVMEANDNDESDKVIGLICGAIRTLRSHRSNPDNLVYLGLVYLGKLRPSIFSNDCILHALSSLLKRDQAHNFKVKANPLVAVLAANLLMRGFADKKNWPENLVKLYIEDALSERVWVDCDECKCFVENIMTAFNTRVPPKHLLQPEVPLAPPRDGHSPSVDDDEGGSMSSSSGEKKFEYPVIPRYSNCPDYIEFMVLEVVKEQVTRRQVETTTRNFLKLLSTTSGLVEIRCIAAPKLEMWLHNPKLMRPAQELLAYVCYNCTSHTQKDVEVISQLVKMRLKTKPVINLYLNSVKELIGLHPENLATILKHTIYNELSTNVRNPNNMPMLAAIFQTSPEQSAKLLADIFLELLMNRDDYLRPLRALLREIVRSCKHEINLLTLAQTLMSDRQPIFQQLQSFEFKERMFISIADLLCLCMFLGITPQVREAAILCQRGDKKDIGLVQQFHKLVTSIQMNAITWLQTLAQSVYGVGKQEILHAMHKVLLLEPSEQYYKLDNWPSEADRGYYMRMVAEVPLDQEILTRILTLTYAKELGLSHLEILELADQLIRRAALHSSEFCPTLNCDRIDIIDLFFNLCQYQAPVSINIPPEYTPPTLAITNLYWKSWILLLMLAAHNPTTIGDVGWKHYPTLRTLIEMCITNHFAYPPPTQDQPDLAELERNKEIQFEVLEKQEILEYECHLAAGSTKQHISESTSLLLPQLITLDPKGMSRRPPTAILEQLQVINVSFRLGHLLCRSRKPDFLIDIIQRQQHSSSQSMPWLADLVQNSEGSFSQLPVQCLCEFLLSAPDKQPRQQQLLAHLQKLLSDPNEDQQHACEVVEYFFRRLSSQQSASRAQAINGLKLVLESVSVDEERMQLDSEEETWLLQKLPSIPHFLAVRHIVSNALRSACVVENNPDLIRAYISFLSVHTEGDDFHDLYYLANEISQVVVERHFLVEAILPPNDSSERGKHTLHCFMAIFCNYLRKARNNRDQNFQIPWQDTQDLVLIQWASGEQCTIHVLVVHSMIILLTYHPTNDDPLFDEILDMWFPLNSPAPKAFLIDTNEEAMFVPDWLRLKMIRSNIGRLLEAAIKDLEPQQLVLFIQSFGLPVSVMSKLLHILDEEVQIDPETVGEAVLDKTYMAQLVEILHKRGATGGLVFMNVLQLQNTPLQDRDELAVNRLVEPLPPGATLAKPSVIQCSVKNDVTTLINKLFIMKIPVAEKMDAYRTLYKTLAKDLQRSRESKAVVLALDHICSVLTSMQVKDFLASLVMMPQCSCSLMRLILQPLKKPSTPPKVVELARSVCMSLLSMIGDVKAPILGILRDFVNQQVTATPSRRELANLIRTQEPGSVLESTDTMSLEVVGRKMVDVCLRQQKNDQLVEAMASLLVTDSNEELVRPRTGLLIDWLASVEPELIGTCPNLQMRLLFGKTKVHVKIDESVVSSHSCRPYLLTLLTHRASWETLFKCVEHLLDECHESYDPTAVLDFLWALTCNPKLWQGRDKFTPKHYVPEDILFLTVEQLLNLVAYVVEEGVVTNNRENRKTALHKMEARLDLILHCISSEDKLACCVVKYLAEHMMDPRELHADMAHQFLLQLYMKIPKVICYLDSFQSKKFVEGARIKDWTGSVLDCMSHSLLTALAATPRQKSWTSKSLDFEICARKMAAVHPLLVLRQLPMLASSLMGRSHSSFSQFKAGHHLNLFIQIMGLLELLQPHLFNDEHRPALENTLENYFQCFQYYSPMKDMIPLLNRFVALLQAYIAHDAQRAVKYLHKHVHVLHELQNSYPQLTSLRSLKSVVPLPRDGDDGESPVAITSAPSVPETSFVHSPVQLEKLDKIHGDDVFQALQEIEHVSSRKPAVLEPIIDNIAQLLVSPQGNVRSLAHTLIARVLKHKPKPDLTILAAFKTCLDSSRADVVTSALDRLPDMILCMQEYALPLMQKVFELGITSNVNTLPHITKTIALLNIQQGC